MVFMKKINKKGGTLSQWKHNPSRKYEPKEKKWQKGKGGLYMSKGREQLRVKYIVK